MKTSLISSLWEIFKEKEESKITETIVAAYGNKVGKFFVFAHLQMLIIVHCKPGHRREGLYQLWFANGEVNTNY